MEMTINMDLLILQVETIAKQHGIKIQYLLPTEDPLTMSMANPYLRTVNIPRMFDDVTYLIALHEIGHLVADGGFDPERAKEGLAGATAKMETEDASWNWCKANAVIWTLEMESLHGWARETYRQNYVAAFKDEKLPHLRRSIKEWK